ncbi:lantibiotic dehydratase [Actinosynnema mirum]|uniref:Lantibiotic dehydratase domain protein n=1 Tax=Actinosynnema mirum (strain ATCC 29888 / DSM 43827 / JCM 3225 / NBRC 14064 / NCIMB 13271 / NRRL B-12336 / IMRU 3971 / 101) TaxID=446462 RepID=C6WEE0_ACTMD|nr:lantibiotic dehydratase [Actinosynnema mirum]ACU37740.1 Lantibiotic dehydratase domain protein [Actinosynnema mirum DSM 43827]
MTGHGTSTELAPYALVRVAALAHPGPAGSDFRAALAALAAVEADLAALAGDLAEALHDSAAHHGADFHRAVVLPLRRDVHNHRPPHHGRDLGDLPERVPLLARWLAAHGARAEAEAAALAAWPDALARSRAWLARVCAADAPRLASALTGADLLQGMDRTARLRGVPDRRARKAEPTLLRYALRATAKTSPLSWHTHVGWSTWDDRAVAPPLPGPAVSHPAAHRLLVTRFATALGPLLPHRVAAGLRVRDGRVLFRRDTPVAGVGRADVVREEEVDVAATGPLRFVIALVRDAGPPGLRPAEVEAALAARLPEGSADAARGFVARARELGLLVPVPPVHPQERDPLTALATWLADQPAGQANPDPAALATRLTALARTTAEFGVTPAPARAAVLAELSGGWRELGERVGADLTGVAPVVEDVVLPEATTTPLGAFPELALLTPLLIAFDQHVLLRRLITARFTERFGVGGVASPADSSGPITAAWQDSTSPVVPTDPAARELLAVREELAGAVRGGVITDALLDRAAGLLPAWTTRRPGSYGFFAQPTGDGRLVVNRVYSGFGKFTSRFLDLLPGAREAVTAQVLRHTDDPVQFRPVRGFNPNLHPLVGAREVGEDARWADLLADDLDVRHDPDADEVRVTLQGRPLDVLYLGFMVPISLPDRQAALYSDLSCGWIDLDALREREVDGGVTRLGPLAHRNVVLARRSWGFPVPPVVGAEERAALDVALLRARHGLPEHVFVGPDGAPDSAEAYRHALTARKPQYADLGDPLHLRCLPRLLAGFPDGVRLTEALPVPGTAAPDGRVVELVAETYWRNS